VVVTSSGIVKGAWVAKGGNVNVDIGPNNTRPDNAWSDPLRIDCKRAAVGATATAGTCPRAVYPAVAWARAGAGSRSGTKSFCWPLTRSFCRTFTRACAGSNGGPNSGAFARCGSRALSRAFGGHHAGLSARRLP
jgi:hypothetical protein